MFSLLLLKEMLLKYLLLTSEVQFRPEDFSKRCQTVLKTLLNFIVYMDVPLLALFTWMFPSSLYDKPDQPKRFKWTYPRL